MLNRRNRMNNCTYVGRLTRNVELRGQEQNVASSGIAIKRPFHREGEPETDFFTVTVIGNRAKTFAKYAHTGSRVCVVGRTQINSYTNQKTNQKNIYVEIIATDFEFLDSKPEGSNNGNVNQSMQNSQATGTMSGAPQGQSPVPGQAGAYGAQQGPAPVKTQPAPAPYNAPQNSQQNFNLPPEGSLPWDK